MKQLCLEFKNSDAKSRVLRLNNIDDNLDAETVRSAMTKIAAANMFIKKKGLNSTKNQLVPNTLNGLKHQSFLTNN